MPRRDYTPEMGAVCAWARMPRPVAEHRFHPEREWRLDWAWPDLRLAVEIDGVSPWGGGHQRVQGVYRDVEKALAAAALGWALLRITPRQLRDPSLLGAAVEAIAARLR